jgi:uncharacterized protein (DUF1501 family)
MDMTQERTMNDSLDRRRFLGSTLLAGAGTLLTARYAFAAPVRGDARLVCVILRGALDGLSAVPPYGDPDYARLRRELAIGAPGASDGALKLDSTFGLNPGLKFLHESYQAGELAVLHAIATPYRERSHFDGQDLLENGTPIAHGAQTGWLNRALAALPRSALHGREAGVALGQNIPLVMRGAAPVASWSPSVLPDLDADTLQRIADRYSTDPLLSRRLADAMATDRIASEAQGEDGSMMGPARAGGAQAGTKGVDNAAAAGAAGRLRPASYTETVRTAAGFLKRDDGPSVAVFDTTGWDTHANEGNAQGQLTQRLGALDQGMRMLQEQLGTAWQRTAVLIVTEFGRTAAANGTRGTDHGTGAAAFLIGGAVRGGRVISDWPGLADGALYQGRDLKPTTDLRSVLKAVLADHLHVPTAALEQDVFPDSASARPLRDLIRT